MFVCLTCCLTLIVICFTFGFGYYWLLFRCIWLVWRLRYYMIGCLPLNGCGWFCYLVVVLIALVAFWSLLLVVILFVLVFWVFCLLIVFVLIDCFCYLCFVLWVGWCRGVGVCKYGVWLLGYFCGFLFGVGFDLGLIVCYLFCVVVIIVLWVLSFLDLYDLI